MGRSKYNLWRKFTQFWLNHALNVNNYQEYSWPWVLRTLKFLFCMLGTTYRAVLPLASNWFFGTCQLKQCRPFYSSQVKRQDMRWKVLPVSSTQTRLQVVVASRKIRRIVVVAVERWEVETRIDCKTVGFFSQNQ